MFKIPKGAEAYFTLDNNVGGLVLRGMLTTLIHFIPRAILRATISSSRTTTRSPRRRGRTKTSWRLTDFCSFYLYYNRINLI